MKQGDLLITSSITPSNSIPSEWRIPHSKLPPDSQLNVLDFPKQSGLLSDFELKITESYATEIVGAIAAGEWTAEEVTKAFCKRAALAHQVVRVTSYAHCRCVLTGSRRIVLQW